MKKRLGRIVSLCLTVALMTTNIGYLPPVNAQPFTGISRKIIEDTDSRASPSTAKPMKASPSTATSSEATNEATPSNANKTVVFVKMDPDDKDIPEYYSKVTKAGKKFWKFEDRYGAVQYRDYGFIKGEAEFPVWYETDQTGTVTILSDFINLDGEYYDLAPCLYESAEPTKTDWVNLLQRLDVEDSIEKYSVKELTGFKNWDSSLYTILAVKGNDEDSQDLGYFFYGCSLNNKTQKNEWYYADEDGNINSMQSSSMGFNLLTNLAITKYIYKYHDKPGYLKEKTSTKIKYTSKTKTLGDMYDTKSSHYDNDDVKSKINFTSNFIGWFSRRASDKPIVCKNSKGDYVTVQGDPASTKVYAPSGTLYSSGYKANNCYSSEINGLWCPENADMFIFFKDYESVLAGWRVSDVKFDIQAIIVRRNEYFDVALAGKPEKQGYEFKNWRFYNYQSYPEWLYPKEGDTLYGGHNGDLHFVKPVFTPLENTVTFVDYNGNDIGEPQIVVSGQSAIAPTEIPTQEGYKFIGWDHDISSITSNVIIKAKYKKIPKITLTFKDSVAGNVLQVLTVFMGDGIKVPELNLADMPVIEGYTLTGNWAWSSSVGFNGDFNSIITNQSETYGWDDNITIYPETTINNHNIYLNANDGTDKSNVIAANYNSLVNNYVNYETRSLFNRTGYTCSGWSTSPTEDKSIPTRMPDSDVQLYAIWKPNHYTISFISNASDVSNPRSKYKTYGDTLGDLATLSRPGYKFLGWFTSEYSSGSQVTSETPVPSGNTKYYAHWDYSYVNITYDDCIPGSTCTKSYKVWVKQNLYNILPRLDRYGYLLGGWWTGKGGTGDRILQTWTLLENEDIKLYAYWIPKTIYVYYMNNFNSTDTNYTYERVLFGDAFGEMPVPEQDDKKFLGWYTKRDCGDKVVSASLLESEGESGKYKLYAHWANPENIVTFKDWSGTIIVKRTVPYGESAELPEIPVRTGYRFIGWDKSYENIQADTVLTAQYEISSHHLTLNGNGGSLSSELNIAMDVTAGESLDQILMDKENSATRKFYTFDGWYTDPTGGSKYSESGNKMPDTDLTIYAHWKRSSSEVTFKDWNGSALDTQEVSIGADATSPEIPDRPGYTFTGWDKPLTNIQDHTDITAQYSINGYLLTLDGNGGTLVGNSTKEVVVSFDQSFDQILVDGKDQVKRPGYHFDGWYTSALGGSNYSYSGNQMPSIDVNVFAHWSPNTYKITFNPDHKKWVGGEFKEEHTFDTELGILPAPEIYGWKFDGWWTGKNGSGTKITEHSMIAPKDVVYYGYWKPVIYKVSFVSKAQQPEGESVQIFPVNQAYDEVFHTLLEPEEKGYTFTGWYDGDNKKINPQTIFQPDSGAEGYTYHAGWKANHYKIRFVFNDTDGAPVVTEMNQEYPSRFGTLPTPEKSGYMFVGWFKENGDEVTTGSWIEAGDKEYKARWRANQYTIHFDRNLPESETVENPQDKTVTYALPVGVLPHLNETGYLFLGWFTELDGGSQVKETTLAALGDQTYYGHWVIGIIDNGNGTYRRSGADGKWNTVDDELWWKGLDGISQNSDDKQILTFSNGTSTYADNGNGTHYRTGSGNWISGIELWWSGTDGIPGTDDDIRIYNGGHGSSGTPIYYIDSGNGMYIRPGASGNWASGTEYWWYGADGKPGSADDKQIYGLPGGSGYYIDNGDGTYTRPETGGSWENGTEHWWYGADGKPGTADDRQIHIIPGGSGYYIDNGDGTYTRSVTDGSWENETEHWWYGADGKPGTADDKQIHIIPGGSGYYIDNGDGTYIRPGASGNWASGTEYWWYGADGKSGTTDDKQIYELPGGSGSYVDNGNGTYTRPGTGGSWKSGTEYWWYGADGKPGTADDKQIHIIPGGSGSYINNGDGTYTCPGTGGSWESGTENWWYGPDGKPGTADDRQIYELPGGSGSYIDNGDGIYTRSGTGGSWENGTEPWWYGADGKPGTADDKQIHIIPGGSGSYIDNGDGTYTRPGTDGSWGTNEDEIWNSGPDGKPGTADDYKQIDTEPTNQEPSKPEPTNQEPSKPEPTDPEPPKLEPIKESEGSSETEIVTSPMKTIIDSKDKPTAPDTGGVFQVDPDNPYDVTYKKPDGSIASDEWVGDGEDWYHVDSRGKLNYDWYLDGQKTWYKLNKETGDKFGAAFIGWNHETMDDKKYFFDPKTTQMLTGWQCIDHKWYYFTKQNEAQTYYGTNDSGWKYDPKMPGKPYGSMYQNEKTPDGYRVDENGIWIKNSGKE